MIQGLKIHDLHGSSPLRSIQESAQGPSKLYIYISNPSFDSTLKKDGYHIFTVFPGFCLLSFGVSMFQTGFTKRFLRPFGVSNINFTSNCHVLIQLPVYGMKGHLKRNLAYEWSFKHIYIYICIYTPEI